MLLHADRILFPDAAAPVAGWIEIAGDRIVATGVGDAPRPADAELAGLVVPGYVDVHSHGGGGASFVTEDPDVARRALAAHRRCGVTTMVASLVTGAPADLERQVSCLAGLAASGELAGVHLEGPWLATEYKGAHPPQLLADPEPAAVARLLDAGRGAVRMVTIAPERPGALESIRLMAERGVVAAIGHTDADYDTCRAAIDAGATGATHLFNAMAPLRHREPGPVLALWEDRRVFLELIMDGVHVRPELVAFVMASEPDRVVLVTDAMAAAGSADGDYVLGELPVEVRDGVARIAGTDTIAGSTLTLDRAVRNAVAAGVPLAQAVRAATALPADYLGLAEVGRLAPGKCADLVVLDDALAPVRVLHRGEWLPSAD
ncbi:MAG TPA: N-acetylglucosamine-6-phosphate deacetylase [Propionicimonas sp.]|nr:N-acetylglucosamine-6-phosphate deacetylase [Propionicimonas sp.]